MASKTTVVQTPVAQQAKLNIIAAADPAERLSNWGIQVDGVYPPKPAQLNAGIFGAIVISSVINVNVEGGGTTTIPLLDRVRMIVRKGSDGGYYIPWKHGGKWNNDVTPARLEFPDYRIADHVRDALMELQAVKDMLAKIGTVGQTVPVGRTAEEPADTGQRDISFDVSKEQPAG